MARLIFRVKSKTFYYFPFIVNTVRYSLIVSIGYLWVASLNSLHLYHPVVLIKCGTYSD